MRFSFIERNLVEFEIEDRWLEEANMHNFRRTRESYQTEDADKIQIVPLNAIAPPKRAESVRWFDKERMVNILRAFMQGSALPPVKIIKNSDALGYQYRFHDGFHRYYASVAAGFTCVPSIIYSENDFVI